MNIAIVGAGITGISTALELAHTGHQVTVYEQLNATAEDASFAPGGWLSPCALQTLAAPGAGMPLQRLLSNRALLQGSTLLGSKNWRWLQRWKKHEKLALKSQDFHLATQLQKLASYSQALRWKDCPDAATNAELSTGHLVILRTQQDYDYWKKQTEQLTQQGLRCLALTPERVRQLEPGLGPDMPIAGALCFPDGESINPRLWTQHLRTLAQSLGVIFHTGACIDAIQTQPAGVKIENSLYLHDKIVLCTGAYQELANQIGIQLPGMTITGYSVTAPIRDTLHAPHSAVMDWAQQITISRIGQRVRITAGAELNCSTDSPNHNATLQRMYTLLNDWFPGGVQLSSPNVQIWKGTRLLLPDGLPAVGPSHHPHIWLNAAHGSHGIALAAGCARALADMISGTAPAIDMQAFHPQRFTKQTKK